MNMLLQSSSASHVLWCLRSVTYSSPSAGAHAGRAVSPKRTIDVIGNNMLCGFPGSIGGSVGTIYADGHGHVQTEQVSCAHAHLHTAQNGFADGPNNYGARYLIEDVAKSWIACSRWTGGMSESVEDDQPDDRADRTVSRSPTSTVSESPLPLASPQPMVGGAHQEARR
jgi:hypothetical protein